MKSKLPEWLRRPPGSTGETRQIKKLLRRSSLNTVCEEARCPNIAECFSRQTATFMILGDVCTRGCRFCAVTTGKPHFSAQSFESEGEKVAEAVSALQLRHVVITSVARDDLADGGASGFVKTITKVRETNPETSIEVLVPDFRGNTSALDDVVSAAPDVFNHNLETVPRLYRRVRPGASYKGSLELLQYVKEQAPSITTKTGIMLGLGEEYQEVIQVLRDAREYAVDVFTAGQYLQPTRSHLEVERYVPPEEFAGLQEVAEGLGYQQAFMGPLVRSSYHADTQLEQRRAVG